MACVTEHPQVTARVQVGRQDPVSVHPSSAMMAFFSSRLFLHRDRMALCSSKLIAPALESPSLQDPSQSPSHIPVTKAVPKPEHVTIQGSRPESCPPGEPGAAPAAVRHGDLGRMAFPQSDRGH